ncbi:MAG: TraE/TraK family type IV conjugative transfer system protein [Candidatus Portnoybacteria bacterium]|nr:TraE/TraK family type IV conjugative transfer system protein [Candidatus Portnoybacteria bacterium]
MNGSIEKTKRLGFIEKWAHAEQTSAFLGITLYALIAFCIVLLVTLFKVSTKPQAIYYIPSAQEAGIAYPNRLDKGVICGFASNWLLNRNNFTPATVKDTYQRAMRYMAPELLSRTKASLDEEMTRVTRDNISSLFSLSKDSELADSGTDYKVILTGEKVLYMGKEKLDSRLLRYVITLQRIPPIETNPYGLVVAGVKQEQVEEGR